MEDWHHLTGRSGVGPPTKYDFYEYVPAISLLHVQSLKIELYDNLFTNLKLFAEINLWMLVLLAVYMRMLYTFLVSVYVLFAILCFAK